MLTATVPRERLLEHGEVFTPPQLVNAMLDLVAHECEREDSRFLEPACGDGNFLAEVLRRRLVQVDRRHRAPGQWAAHASLGLACLYGIELLSDNVEACRSRLVALFWDHYVTRYGEEAHPGLCAVAKTIVRTNIVQGDALKMTTVGSPAQPLVLTEWALVGRGRFKRRLFEYRELSPPIAAPSLFAPLSEPVHNEEGKPVFIARHLRDLPLVHYLALAREGTEG